MPEEDSNLVRIFLDRAARYGRRDALLVKDKTLGKYVPVSWTRWAEQVKRTALGLYGLGVRPGDRVAILSENRPEWTYADLGILSLGAAGVPLYPTSSPAEINYILENAGVEILFAAGFTQQEKIQNLLARNAKLRRVIVFDPVPFRDDKLVPFEFLLEKGRREGLNNPDLYLRQAAAVRPSDLATIIYTSGTTGPPKGVMLSHRNFIENCRGAAEPIKISESDLSLSFLPLSHVFERVAGYYFMIFQGATIAYAESMQTVGDDIRLVRPTLAAAVPRFYEKTVARIYEQVETAGPLAKKLFLWAVRTGRKRGLRRFLADRLVWRKIRARLGGRLRFFISGGAPLPRELGEFFYAAGILILEGYGLTETSPVISVNSEKSFCFGTVGRPLPNAEVKIAEDGEILTRGPCVMLGYYQNEAATAEVMKDGWFHTGDIGAFDAGGFLKITDRKKDIIVTSGGKNISPQNIENLILGDKLFSQAVVLGDRRHYLVALLAPDRAEVERYARQAGLDGLAWEEILSHPRVYQWAEERLRERTKELAAYEQIKYFAFLPKELSQENGELTPTLKIRRKVVMEKYRDTIERLYQKRS